MSGLVKTIGSFWRERRGRSIYRDHDTALVLAANEAYHRVEARIYDQAHPEILWCERDNWITFSKKYLGPTGIGRTILDVGAGTGFIGQTIAPYLTNKDRYIALDLSKEMLDVLAKKMSNVPFNVERHVASASRIPLAQLSVDMVLVSSAMHHFPEPDRVFEQIRLVLKPGGILVVMHEPNVAFSRSWLMRKFAGVFSRIASRIDTAVPGGQTLDFTPVFDEVNRDLLERKLIEKPLSRLDIQALVDVQSPTASGRFEPIGFNPAEWTVRGPLQGWHRQSFATYNYLGKLDPTIKVWRRTIERVFSLLLPDRGSLFSIVLRKPDHENSKKTLNILMTSDTYYPDIGGAEMHVFYLQKHLRQLGHRITLFVTNPKSSPEDADFPVVRDRWKLWRVSVLFLKIWKLSADVDIIHCHYSYKLASVAGLVAFIRRKPMIITQHGMGLLNQAGARGVYRVLHSIYRFVSLRLATHTISTSQDLADFQLKFHPSASIEVIPNGIDALMFDSLKIAPSQDERLKNVYPVLMTVRRLAPKNGVQYVIPILPELRKVYPKIKFVMIGDGRMREPIVRLIAKYGVGDVCIFMGTQPQKQVAELAMRADLVLFPSTAESTSLACAEMMCLGKRILASRVGGLIELLGQQEERGWFTKLVDWEASDYEAPEVLTEERYAGFTQDVVRVLCDERGNEKTKAARLYASQELDWPVIARKTVAVYRQTLESFFGV